jgi:glycosyltransferase involved in cell wall biosynthesis
MVEIQSSTIQGSTILIDSKYKSEFLIVAGIPAYNEEKTIAKVVIGAQRYAHVVIVCDDGSSDMTAEIAEKLGAVVVRHPKNVGYGGALQSLFKKAKELTADILVTLDSDGQHDAQEIPMLIKPIEEGSAEVVFGSRFMNTDGTAEMPAYRQLGVKIITKLAAGTGKITDGQSGFRAYSKQALSVLSMSDNGMGASIELLHAVNKRGLKVCEVPITCKYANSIGEKTSSEHPITHGLGILFSILKLVIEDRPLLFLGFPGIASLITGILFGVWMLQIYAQSHNITTNIALASISFILIGFFLVSTSITLYAIARLRQKMPHN